MAINLQRIEEELKRQRAEVQRLEDVRRILSDPRSAALVEEAIRDGDDSYRDRPLTRELEEVQAGTDGQANLELVGGASQASIVRNIVSQQSGRFTVGSIGDQVRAVGIDMTNIAVGRVLQRMHKKHGTIRIARRGGGGSSPNWYERVPPEEG